MGARTTSSQRIKVQNVAEREIMRYAGDHALWHKHVHNVELDPVQILKMHEMDKHANTIDFSSRRTGKTATKELYDNEELACNSDQELGIVAPREAQSIVNLNYHLDAVRRSPILTAYLAHKSGRQQMSDTRFEFANRSKAQAYGIMAQVDGGDLTMASLEEVDDMPRDRLYSRFLLMLGSARRLGASKNSKNDPKIRITGVFKGADTLTDLLKTGGYHALGCFTGERARRELLKFIDMGYLHREAVNIDSYEYPVPIANAVNAMALGMLNEQFIKKMHAELSHEEFARQLLCINLASRNLVWEQYMQYAIQLGVQSKLEITPPMPGETYKRRGLISFGYDHSGHGESPEASRSALVVKELLGGYRVPIYARTWKPGTDDGVVKRDLISAWRYFMPDVAHGDAYGVGMLTQLNDELYAMGLTKINRKTIGDGDSTASTWGEWPFSPIRYEGMLKHQMATALRASYHNKQAAIPYFDIESSQQEEQDMAMLCRQTVNIKNESTTKSYDSYKMADPKIGDDLFDADMAAEWGLVTRGVGIIDTIISSSTQSYEQLTGERQVRLPSDPAI